MRHPASHLFESLSNETQSRAPVINASQTKNSLLTRNQTNTTKTMTMRTRDITASMKGKLKILTCFVAGMLALAGAAHAQIAVKATMPGTSTASATAPALATSAAFDMNGGNAVALIVTTEASAGNATNMFASFAGQPMTLGVRTNQGAQGAFIFYLLNPATTSGSFDITSSNGSGGLVYSAMALGNVSGVAVAGVAAAANTLNTGTTSLTNTLATNGGFVFSAAVNNGFNVGSPQPLSSSSSVANQTLYPSTIVGSSGHLHLYGAVPTAGTYTQVYTNRSNSGQRNAYVMLAFETGNVFTNLFWGVGSGTWDINTTASWTNDSGLTTYKELGGVGNPVTFDDTRSGSSPITVTLDTSVSPTSVVVSNSTKTYTLSGSGGIGGGATLTKTGNGTLTLGTANAYAGGSILNGGTTVFSALNNLGAGNITFGGGTLQYNGNNDDLSVRTVTFATGGATLNVGANDVYFGNPVGNGGSGGLTKLGAGILSLTGANNYSGNTTISQGTLLLAGTIPGSTNIVLSSGTVFDASPAGGYTLSATSVQTLTGVGSINGDLTSPTGTRIVPAATNTVGTLVFSNSLTVGGTLEFNVTTTGSDQFLIGGILTLNPGSVLNVTSSALTNGLYRLFRADSGLSGSVGNFTVNFTQAGKSGDLVNVVDGSTNTIYLEVANLSTDDLTWSGVGANWDLADTLNWYLGAGVTPWAFTNGATVRFNETGVANAGVSLQDAVKPSLVVVSNATDYSFNDGTGVGGGKVSGTARVLKQNSGKLTVNTVNDTTGSTTIQGGTLEVFGHLGSGAVTNNAALVFQQADARTVSSLTGTGALTQQGSSTLTVAGTANYTGPTTISSGATLTIGTGGAAGALSTSAITNDGTLRLNSSTTWNYSMSDTGTGTLRKEGTNAVTLSGVNNRTGETRVDSGKVILGNANQLKGSARLEGTGVLDMNGLDQLVLDITGAGGVITNGGGTGTNTLTLSNAVGTAFSAVIQTNTGGGGAIAVVKTGSGTLNWQANDFYGGGTEIREGTVRIISTTPFGSGPVNMTGGAIQFQGGTMANTINLLPPVGSTTNTFSPTANLFSPAPLVGTQDLIINFGSSGSTFSMNGGAAKWAGLTNTTYLRGTAIGWLRFDSGSDARNVTFDLSDSPVHILANGVQTIHLGGLIGNTNTVAIGDSEACTVFVGNKNLSTTFAGQLGGNFSWVKVGSGTQTLTGTNTTTGSLTVSNATLVLALDAAPSNMNPITVVSNATLNVSALADYIVQTNELGEVTNSYYVTNATLSLGTGAVAQTLRGGGTVAGNVVIGTNATVTPGTSIGTLTISSALTLNGTAIMELDRTSSPTADRINAGSFSGTGTVNVTNIGPDMVTGDTFQLFSGAVSGLTVNLPASNALNTVAYVWTNKVELNGSIQLLSGVSPIASNPTNITFSAGGGNLNLSWPPGHLGWILQSQTNLLGVGLSTNWSDVAGSASVTATNFPLSPANPAVFYRLRKP
jgi:fibronectin-binding autotransporter adhesin